MTAVCITVAFGMFVMLVGYLAQAYAVESCVQHTGFGWFVCYASM